MDIFNYEDNVKYDIVCCTEFFGNTKDIREILYLIGKYAKLIFVGLYSKIDNLPEELTAFDREIETLEVINEKIRKCGYNITAIDSDTDTQLENYITWNAKRDIKYLRKFSNDEKVKE